MSEVDSFGTRCLDVLKAIGKTLSQLNLYNAKHPAVKKMTADTVAELAVLLIEAGGGEIVYSIDNDKVVANGKIIGQISQLPNSIPQIFTKYKLDSVVFKQGLTEAELTAFSEMAAMRPDAAKSIEPGTYLPEKGVTHIVMDEAVYSKVEELEESKVGAKSAEDFIEETKDRSLEDTIQALVKMAVPDPAQQKKLMEAVMARVREDLEKQVNEATKELTFQKQTLENEQARTQGVMEGMATGVVVVDDQGQVLMMNPEAEELFGKNLSEMAGTPLQASASDTRMVLMSNDLALPKDRAIESSVQSVSDADTQRTLRASTAVVHNEAGKPVGVVQAISDEAKHRELQKREREFVAHVTHELRAPLSSIRAALEIVEEMISSNMDPEAKKMFNNAMRNTDRLEDLVNSILDFGKLESGQMSVNPKVCRPDVITREAAEGMMPWATKKGINLVIKTDEDLPEVFADWKRTVQVIVNLLSNAIKFTPKEGTITVLVGPGTAGDKRVLFQVKDTGVGIAKEEQARVFEKFQQIQSGERHVGGTGLGLAIAKALIHMQKGKMWLESDVGKGATFLFTLPEHDGPRKEKKKIVKASTAEILPWWKTLLGLN
ncbi:MAG: hypothetical protein COB53_01325 [Elusimicrobia bacterium]|nr:MAG: hypothetical protein COB53_01325 [Elusimicrobiota bacterium]